MIFDLGDGREGDLHDLTVRTFDLHTGSGKRLGGLHAANGSTHSSAIGCDDLDVVLAVKRLQRRECLGYFHRCVLRESNMPLSGPEVHRTSGMQPENTIWRIEPVRVFFD